MTSSATTANPTFTATMSPPEKDALLEALRKAQINYTPYVEQMLVDFTGCATFADFKRSVFSSHPLVNPEFSLLLIDHIKNTPKVKKLLFRALLFTQREDTRPIVQVSRTLDRHNNVVHHNLLRVRSDVRRQGLATAISMSHEELWKRSGYHAIKLVAAKEEGRTFWALQGYDFDPAYQSDRQAIVRALLRYMDHAVEEGDLDVDAANLLRQLALSGELPAWDLQLVETKSGDNIGRKAMAQAEWRGIKKLEPTWPGHQQAAKQRSRV